MPHFEVGERIRYRDDSTNDDVFSWLLSTQAIDARALEFTVIEGGPYLSTSPGNYGFNHWYRFESIPEDGKKKKHQKKPSRFKQFLNTHKL